VKTISLKKVSAVAVASLGFGLLSVVPANAASLTLSITSINLTTVTSSPKTNEVVTVNLGAVIPTQSGTFAANDDVRFQAALTTYPVGGSTSVTGAATIGGGTASFPYGLTTATVVAGGGLDLNVTTGADALDTIGSGGAAGGSLGTVTSSATAGMGSFTFTPTKAGTYTLTVWHDTGATPNGELSTAEVRQTVDIVVTAASSYSNALSTAFSISTAGTDPGDATTNLVPLIASKTMSTATRASITIRINNSSNAAMTTGNTITATMSGSGGLAALGTLAMTANAPTATDCSATTVTRVVSAAADDVNTISLCSDGTAGVGTVTISVTDTSGATQVLATKTITFFGDAAKLEVTKQPIKVLVAGGATSGVKTGITGTALATQPAFVVKVTDAGGNPVSGLSSSLSGVSADTTQVSAVSNNEGTAGNDATAIYGGAGNYVFDVTSPVSAKSSATATAVTIRMVDPADSTKFLTTTVSFTVGGTATSVVLTVDKTVYAPGDKGTLTLTAKDASGNPVSDRERNLLSATGLTGSKGLQGALPTAAAVETVSGVKTYTFFAPVSGGAFSINGTVGTGAATAYQGTALTVSSSVTDGNAVLLTQIDALNAKIVALNALIAKIMKKLGVK
jgi:hypothetical protein